LVHQGRRTSRVSIELQSQEAPAFFRERSTRNGRSKLPTSLRIQQNMLFFFIYFHQENGETLILINEREKNRDFMKEVETKRTELG
jgi:hypothetical protein